MADNVIINGSPAIYNLGTKDESIKGTPPRPIIVGRHVPLVFTFAAGGPVDKQIIDPSRLVPLYRKETFDRKKPYFNHQTRLLERVSGAGSTVAIKRIIPEDNDTISNVTIYVDYVKDTVDVYKRHDDGSIAYDDNGNPIVDKQHDGYKFIVIAEYNDDDVTTPMGTKHDKTGHLKNKNGDSSTMVPILEFRGKYKGKVYNNIGFALDLPTKDTVDSNLESENVSLPWVFYKYKRPDENSTGTVIKNILGSEGKQFLLKKDSFDPISNKNAELRTAMELWYNLTNPLVPIIFPDFEEPYVYYDNLETVQKDLLSQEKDYYNTDVTTVEGHDVNTIEWLDFLADKDIDEQWSLINPFTAKSIKRVPAFTYYYSDDDVTLKDNEKEVYFSKGTPIYLGKGKDGTLTEEEFEKGVRKFVAKYSDPNSDVMDIALNVENVLYDSGFTIDTKKTLVNFISIRKDTILALGTRVDNLGRTKWDTLETQRSIGLLLKARLGLAPESTFFGTPVTRAFIVVGSGLDSLDPSNRRYSLVLDLATKASRMMSGESWKAEELFDSGERNVILEFTDIEPKFIPQGIKPVLWNIGLIWPQPYAGNLYTFPQLQSVYDNDMSILNNIFAAFALTIINKVADAAQRKYSGSISLTPSQLSFAVTNYMENELKDKFSGLFKIKVKTEITDYDAIRGYSWTTITEIGGEIMKTVMTHYIIAKRKEDM